jgi:hypothetical protein
METPGDATRKDSLFSKLAEGRAGNSSTSPSSTMTSEEILHVAAGPRKSSPS